METYRQPLRIHEKYATMLDMVSDLTGLVRRYHGNWKRPLAENRKDLREAKRLGNTIVGIASQRPWREGALQDILRSLQVQDRKMHTLVTNILTDARVTREIAAHRALQSELQLALQSDDSKAVWEISGELYKLSQRTLTFLAADPEHNIVFSGNLVKVKEEDPLLYRRIVFTLNEVARMHPQRKRREVPQPRFPRHEVEVYRSS